MVLLPGCACCATPCQQISGCSDARVTQWIDGQNPFETDPTGGYPGDSYYYYYDGPGCYSYNQTIPCVSWTKWAPPSTTNQCVRQLYRVIEGPKKSWQYVNPPNPPNTWPWSQVFFDLFIDFAFRVYLNRVWVNVAVKGNGWGNSSAEQTAYYKYLTYSTRTLLPIDLSTCLPTIGFDISSLQFTQELYWNTALGYTQADAAGLAVTYPTLHVGPLP